MPRRKVQCWNCDKRIDISRRYDGYNDDEIHGLGITCFACLEVVDTSVTVENLRRWRTHEAKIVMKNDALRRATSEAGAAGSVAT